MIVETIVPTPSSDIKLKAIKVAREDDTILTILFPIKREISDWSYLFNIFKVNFALFLPSSAFTFILTLLQQVSAVSKAEKKALPSNNKTIARIKDKWLVVLAK